MLEKIDDTTDIRPFQLMKTFYQTCLNHGELDFLGSKPLLDTFNKLGGWPVLKPVWNEDQHDWETLYTNTFKEGFTSNILINVELVGDPRDHTRYIIFLKSIATHPLNSFKTFLKKGLEIKQVKAYLKYMIAFSELLGAEKLNAERDMRDVLNFEAEYYKVK